MKPGQMVSAQKLIHFLMDNEDSYALTTTMGGGERDVNMWYASRGGRIMYSMGTPDAGSLRRERGDLHPETVAEHYKDSTFLIIDIRRGV